MHYSNRDAVAARHRAHASRPTFPGLTRAEALGHLPPAYSLALRLRAAGLPVALIAECLDVEPEALGPLFEVAEAKLAALLDDARS